jgi:phosphosulfolactate synthase (CoM biosynthesis protein A)
MGHRYLADLLETMGAHVDSLKFAGGSFTVMPESSTCSRLPRDEGLMCGF